MFDSDPHTLARTFEANPAIIELVFPTPRLFQGVSVIIGSTQAEIKAALKADPPSKPVEFDGIFSGSVEQPRVDFKFHDGIQASIFHLEIRDLHQAEPGNVHIWEINFLER